MALHPAIRLSFSALAAQRREPAHTAFIVEAFFSGNHFNGAVAELTGRLTKISKCLLTLARQSASV